MVKDFNSFIQNKFHEILDSLNLKAYKELGEEDDYYIIRYENLRFEIYFTGSRYNIKVYKNNELNGADGGTIDYLKEYLEKWII